MGTEPRKPAQSLLRRYSLLGWFALSMALLLFVFPNALNIPQSNPTEAAEFAPALRRGRLCIRLGRRPRIGGLVRPPHLRVVS